MSTDFETMLRMTQQMMQPQTMQAFQQGFGPNGDGDSATAGFQSLLDILHGKKKDAAGTPTPQAATQPGGTVPAGGLLDESAPAPVNAAPADAGKQATAAAGSAAAATPVQGTGQASPKGGVTGKSSNPGSVTGAISRLMALG
jgi:hypothetical protein